MRVARRTESREALRHLVRNTDDRRDELFIDVGNALVLDVVSFRVGSVEDAPLLVRKVQGVRKRLEDEISVFGPIAMPPQSRQRERMRGVVSQIEAAVDRQRPHLRIAQPRKP